MHRLILCLLPIFLSFIISLVSGNITTERFQRESSNLTLQFTVEKSVSTSSKFKCCGQCSFNELCIGVIFMGKTKLCQLLTQNTGSDDFHQMSVQPDSFSWLKQDHHGNVINQINSVQQETCPAGFNMTDVGCFFFETLKETFEEARSKCEELADNVALAVTDTLEVISAF